jgi:hypothetical protein
MTPVTICIFDQQLRAKQQKACPFTPIHITGKRMAIADIPSQLFGSSTPRGTAIPTMSYSHFLIPLSHYPHSNRGRGLQDSSARDSRLADEAFRAGRLVATSIARETRWRHWKTYLTPIGFDPYLQLTSFEQQIRSLTGFAQRTRTGYYGRGRQVQVATVTGITAAGQTISLAIGHNPTKVIGSDKFLRALQVMIEGFAKEDPPTRKMLPI